MMILMTSITIIYIYITQACIKLHLKLYIMFEILVVFNSLHVEYISEKYVKNGNLFSLFNFAHYKNKKISKETF